MPFKTGLNIKTFQASAILGLRVGYSNVLITLDEVKNAIKESANKIENYTFSGTLTPTNIFVAKKDGVYEEPAISVDTSIYPRFPEEQKKFKNNFTQFIGNLASALKQERIAIRFSDESLMLETEYCTKPDLK